MSVSDLSRLQSRVSTTHRSYSQLTFFNFLSKYFKILHKKRPQKAITWFYYTPEVRRKREKIDTRYSCRFPGTVPVQVPVTPLSSILLLILDSSFPPVISLLAYVNKNNIGRAERLSAFAAAPVDRCRATRPTWGLDAPRKRCAKRSRSWAREDLDALHTSS